MATIDYARMQRTHRTHKAALTRAVRSGSVDKIKDACRKAVAEWDEIGAWPDDWSTWQRALNDVLPWHSSVALQDLATACPPPVCEWFAACRNPADGVVLHPVLTYVPTCHRCADRAGQTVLPVEWIAG